MKCPACKKPMIVLELNQVEIDHCAFCGGIWLDSGELELLLGNLEKASSMLNSFAVDSTIAEKKVKCPICRSKMVKVLCGPERKIVIDKCASGDGLWFDKGELYDIVNDGHFGENSDTLDFIKEIFKNSIVK
ncbi:MAG: hypothetical protein CO189_01415 [candidate division Zixibacteria bacterium CG_4_9_14_3_um_filter_46_8]|nr:MAG: hypothetical protein CO189_01415 [candidate division Zixibacteria bacterium CG_4_9_14_3_um_filter_46_8]